MKIALIQMKVNTEMELNIQYIKKTIKELSNQNIDLIMLPEMFCCPYETSNFPLYAEQEGGALDRELANIARDNNIYLIAGSVPEKDGDKIYNTSYVYNRMGEKIAKHRKVHLFDINVRNGQKFKESDTLFPGDKVTVFDTEFGRFGLAICFDIRFPELFRKMTKLGAKAIFVPAAFNMTTGPAHWETLFKARALDNQVYTIGTASARDNTAKYCSYGHSIIVSPWGNIENELEYEEDIIISDLDLNKVEDIREQLPVLKSLRNDIYDIPDSSYTDARNFVE